VQDVSSHIHIGQTSSGITERLLIPSSMHRSPWLTSSLSNTTNLCAPALVATYNSSSQTPPSTVVSTFNSSHPTVSGTPNQVLVLQLGPKANPHRRPKPAVAPRRSTSQR
jgi:hypothetical protein